MEFNFQSENYEIILPHLPDKADYNADGFLRDARAKFDAWYDANYHSEFCLKEQLADYCKSGALSVN